MDATENDNVFVLYKSNLMTTFVKRGLIWATLGLLRLLKRERFALAEDCPLVGFELPQIVVFDVVFSRATEDIKRVIAGNDCGKRGTRLGLVLPDVNKLPSEGLTLLVKLVNVVHLCAILETGNEIYWFHSALIA